MTDTWWKDVDELVPEQAGLLDVDENKSLLINGPPGSGKTNLLLLRANQLYLGEMPNLHIVVFGSLLKQFIKIGGAQYSFPAEKVVTHAKLFNDILRAEGIGVDDGSMSLDAARAERASRMQELVDTGAVGVQFEALLLDEAQDYTSQEILLMRSLANVFVAAADSRQRIYAVQDCTNTLEQCTDEVYPLKYHFRNGLEICRAADGVLKGDASYTSLLKYSNYKESDYPSKCTPIGGLSLDEQVVEMAQRIKDQQFAYPNELIGVLCPRNEELDYIQSALGGLGLSSVTTRANSSEFDATKPIWLSTLTAAKGLEFRVVHIAGLDFLHRMGGAQKRLIYTGITRAKTSLSLYWHKSIPGYLESALAFAYPQKAPVSKKQIFGKQ